MSDDAYDVVVVGGGPAGLSGATALARFRRRVLVVDSGEPRNAAAGHVHNFLAHDGTPPAELAEVARRQLAAYGGQLETAYVEAVGRDDDGFRLEVGGRTVRGRRLLVTTGLADELPDVPGLAARWGRDVLHCPYCHGWEVRDQRIGVLVTGPSAVHQALLFRQLSPRVTVLQHTGPALAEDQLEQLAALGVTVVEGVVTGLLTEDSADGSLTGVRLGGGAAVALDALVVAPRLRARAELLAPLGIRPVDIEFEGQAIGTRVDADPTGATVVPGLFVAGNLTDPQAQVVTSAAAGLRAASMINADLVSEDAAAALRHYRQARVFGEQAWDERYGVADRIWSGNPNAVLVDEVADLPPGTALEAGCGEGGDAIWLAQQGWEVTAADLSSVALARAAEQAGRLGARVTWTHLDLTQEPAGGTYDLVSAFFLHLPKPARAQLWRHLAEAVAPGGTLLVVGHDFSDQATPVERPGLAEMGWTTNEVVEALGPGWTVVTTESRPRTQADHQGHEAHIHDAVVRAVRVADARPAAV